MVYLRVSACRTLLLYNLQRTAAFNLAFACVGERCTHLPEHVHAQHAHCGAPRRQPAPFLACTATGRAPQCQQQLAKHQHSACASLQNRRA